MESSCANEQNAETKVKAFMSSTRMAIPMKAGVLQKLSNG